MTLLEDRYSIMSKFSLVEKRILKLMIVDCDIHHMTERESINYISKRFGREGDGVGCESELPP